MTLAQDSKFDENGYVIVTCRRYRSDFCYNACGHRSIGCAGKWVNPRKKKAVKT